MKSYQSHLKTTINLDKKDITRKPVFRSSAIFPVCLSKEINVNIYFLGYWLLKRNINEISLLTTIRNQSGSVIYRNSNIIDHIKSYKISLKKILKTKNNFFGSIELEFNSIEDLVFPFPALIINYESKKSSSVVHTCGRIFNDLEDQIKNNIELVSEGGFDILPKKNFLPFFSFVNGPTRILNQTLKLKILNFQGETIKKNIILKKIEPYETKFIFFLKDKEKKFLRGKKGSVNINHSFTTFFPRFLAGNIEKNFSSTQITHTYYDLKGRKKSSDYWLNKEKKKFFDITIPIPFFYKHNYQTELAIYPNFVKSNFNLNVKIVDDFGKSVCGIENVIKIRNTFNKPVYLNINDLIKKKISLFKYDRTYYCKFYSATKHKTPSRLKFALNILNNKKNSLPTNICFNGIIPNKTFLKKKGAFKWGLLQNKFQSLISLSNISFIKKGYKEANVTLSFWSNKPNKKIDKRINIKDNGNFLYDLSKDKKVKKFLNNEVGWITIKSDNPFVRGWYFEFMKNGSIGGDHLF